MERKLYVYFRICVLFKVKHKRYGEKKLESVMKNRIRYAFTLFAHTVSQDDEEGYMIMEPKRVIKDFGDNIVWFLMGEIMKAKTREFNRLVNYMQRKMKQKCQTRNAKENALLSYW